MRRWWNISEPLGRRAGASSLRVIVGGVMAAALMALAVVPKAAAPERSLPERLTDAEFWQLVTGMSESGGYFPSDNLVSNELTFQYVIPRLLESGASGRVYLGVGPDQNFTYLAAVQPSMAFIVDIRRDNLRLQLMYKALMELSQTRIGFLSRLLSRPPPRGVSPAATPEELFTALSHTQPSDALFAETAAAVRVHLTDLHGFALDADDVATIEYVLSAFRYAGPLLAYANTGRMGRYPSYQDLMQATDQQGVQRSYLASEALYSRVRALQLRNMVVPVVGDFANDPAADGALRKIGRYLKAHDAVVGTIYTSNVEQYLFQYGIWPAYYANVDTLPLDARSMFVRSCFNQCRSTPGSRSVQLLDPVQALLADIQAGKVRTYYDVLTHSR